MSDENDKYKLGKILKKLKRGETVFIENEIRDYIYVEDVVNILLEILFNFDKYKKKVVNVCGEPIYLPEIALKLKSKLKSKSKIVVVGKKIKCRVSKKCDIYYKTKMEEII